MDVKGSVQRQFGRVAASYASSAVFSSGVDLEAIEREAAAAGPARALDVGTAAGHVAMRLASHAGLVVGLDLTGAMLVQAAELARQRGHANVRVCQGDVEHLPIATASVDLVTCRFSGHHFPNPGLFAREAARVLRPGGQLLLADTVAPADGELDGWINRVEVLRDPSHVRDYSVAEWSSFLGSAELSAELLLDWRLRLDFDDWTARQRTPPEREAEIRTMFRAARPAQREAFGLETPDDAGWSFQLHCAVVRARKPA